MKTSNRRVNDGAPRGAWLVVLCGFTLITAALTYPQVLAMSSAVGQHYDSLFGVWRIAWIAHQLRTDPLHLFDANIFYPEPNTLAYSDATLLLGFAGAPLIWAGASPVLVYNLFVLLSFVSSGVAMYWLARSLGGSQTAGWLSGIVFAFHPYRFAHYAQIELLWTCWIPLAFWALHRVIATGRPAFGAILGLMVALQTLSCLYYGVFLVTALVILAPILMKSFRPRELLAFAPGAAAAVGVATVLLIPYAWPYMASATLVGVRTAQEVQLWSPTLANYTVAGGEHWWYRSDPAAFDQIEGVLFPGIVTVVVAAIGFFGKPHRWTVAYLVLLLVAFDLSLGFNGWLYRFLYDFVWPYTGLRVPARFFVIVAASLAVLTVAGVGRIESWGAGSRAKPFILSSIVALASLENVSIPVALRRVNSGPPRLYAWLSQQSRGPVLEWPLPPPENLGLTRDPEFMHLSTSHWPPLVNGYSGHHPASYLTLVEQMRSFPAPDAIRYLEETGVRYVLIHSEPDPQRYRAIRVALEQHPVLQLQFVDRDAVEEVAAYRLRSPKPGT